MGYQEDGEWDWITYKKEFIERRTLQEQADIKRKKMM